MNTVYRLSVLAMVAIGLTVAALAEPPDLFCDTGATALCETNTAQYNYEIYCPCDCDGGSTYTCDDNAAPDITCYACDE